MTDASHDEGGHPKETPARPDRRALIAGVAALVAGALARDDRPAEAHVGVDQELLHLGHDNTAPANFSTGLSGGGTSGPALILDNLQGPGVLGAHGIFTGRAPAVTVTAGLVGFGFPGIAAGVGLDAEAVREHINRLSFAPAGLVALNEVPDTGFAVLGFQGFPDAFPVTATATAIGGFARDPTAVGGHFEHTAGETALRVVGRAEFFGPIVQAGGGVQTDPGFVAGVGVAPANQNPVFIARPEVNETSLVIVVPDGQPQRVVQRVEPADGGFTIHFARTPRIDVPFKFVAFPC